LRRLKNKVDDLHVSRDPLSSLGRWLFLEPRSLSLSRAHADVNICPRRPAKIDSSLLHRWLNGKRTLFLSATLLAFFFLSALKKRPHSGRTRKKLMDLNFKHAGLSGNGARRTFLLKPKQKIQFIKVAGRFVFWARQPN
jgi:hypothetical protein